ncbi:MAG: response regulator [Candidatus Rokubacteria bacterium]|nr:response regulator [Candidatus Rokubacteria bacterium]
MARLEAQTVLVVDEDLELLDRLVVFIRALGYIAVPAASIENAEVILEKLHIDLVLLDLAPDAAPGALITRLKAEQPDVYVVVGAEPHQIRAVLAAGGDEAIATPLAAEHLEAVVRRVLPLPVVRR